MGYVILDLETTGLDATLEGILEVAAIRLEHESPSIHFERLINPGIDISPGSQAVHGITAEMVVNAPDFAVILPEFLEFIGDRTLVMHNAPFDMGFLNQALKRLNLPPLSNPVIDTLEWARELFPEQRSLKLASLCRLLGHEATRFHRAMDDCGHLAAIFPALARMHAEKEAWYQEQFPRIGHIARRYDHVARLVEQLQVEMGDLSRILQRYFATQSETLIPLLSGEALMRSNKEIWEYDPDALTPLLEEWGLKERLFKLDRGRLERWLAGHRLSDEQKERLIATRRLAGYNQRLIKTIAKETST